MGTNVLLKTITKVMSMNSWFSYARMKDEFEGIITSTLRLHTRASLPYSEAHTLSLEGVDLQIAYCPICPAERSHTATFLLSANRAETLWNTNQGTSGKSVYTQQTFSSLTFISDFRVVSMLKTSRTSHLKTHSDLLFK